VTRGGGDALMFEYEGKHLATFSGSDKFEIAIGPHLQWHIAH
jgi:hypothetical protein